MIAALWALKASPGYTEYAASENIEHGAAVPAYQDLKLMEFLLGSPPRGRAVSIDPARAPRREGWRPGQAAIERGARPNEHDKGPAADVLDPFASLLYVLDSLKSYNNNLVRDLPGTAMLCHYTSIEGAHGIMTSGDLWLTNARYLNDNEELELGYKVIDEVLEKMIIEALGRSSREGELRELRTRSETREEGEEVFVCCFCEHSDLLSQWRGYAENGGGVGLEFEARGFTPATKEHEEIRGSGRFTTSGRNREDRPPLRRCHLGTSDSRLAVFVPDAIAIRGRSAPLLRSDVQARCVPRGEGADKRSSRLRHPSLRSGDLGRGVGFSCLISA